MVLVVVAVDVGEVSFSGDLLETPGVAFFDQRRCEMSSEVVLKLAANLCLLLAVEANKIGSFGRTRGFPTSSSTLYYSRVMQGTTTAQPLSRR